MKGARVGLTNIPTMEENDYYLNAYDEDINYLLNVPRRCKGKWLVIKSISFVLGLLSLQ